MYSEQSEKDDLEFMRGMELEDQWKKSRKEVTYEELVRDEPSLVQEVVIPSIAALELSRSELNLNAARLVSKAESTLKGDIKMVFVMFAQYLWYEKTRKINRQVSKLKRLIPRQEMFDGEITQDMIDRAREFPLEQLVDGSKRRQQGSLVLLCPFHQEKTPSFRINLSRNRYHCFGCNEDGDSIDYIMKTHEVDFLEAVRKLQ